MERVFEKGPGGWCARMTIGVGLVFGKEPNRFFPIWTQIGAELKMTERFVITQDHSSRVARGPVQSHSGLARTAIVLTAPNPRIVEP